MDSSSDSLLEQIQHGFRFLVDDHGFVVRPPQRSGDVTTVRYEHPLAIIQFTVRHGEWQTLIYPAPPRLGAYQATLDDLVTYLTRPPVDFAANQARPPLSQSEALRDLATRLAPVVGEMLALYEPAGWLAAWDDMQAVLRERMEKMGPQFFGWQDAPDLSDEERRVAEELKAAAEAMLAIPEDQLRHLPNPHKFYGPIGFPKNEMPPGGVAAHVPEPRKSWAFGAAEQALLLRVIGATSPDGEAAAVLPGPDMAGARRNLAHRGLLTERGLDPELAAVLLAIVQPDATIVAAITRPDRSTRQVTLHQRQEQAVVVWVGVDGRHHFDSFPVQQAGAGLWRQFASDLSELLVAGYDMLTRLARQAGSSTIYNVTVTGKNLRQGRAASFGWFMRDKELWIQLAAPIGREPSPEPRIEPAEWQRLEDALLYFCRQVIEGDET